MGVFNNNQANDPYFDGTDGEGGVSNEEWNAE